MSSTPSTERPADAPAAVRRKRREWPYRTMVVLLILASIAITLYPVAGTYYNNWKATQFANSTAQRQNASAAENSHWLAMAHEYNRAMSNTALTDPWTGKDQSTSPEYQAYLKQLAGTQAMARLRIPSIDVDLPILHGTSDDSLHIGVGHMFGTSLPVGGAGTHAALAAHRGLPNMTGFDRLPELKLGDQFFVDVYGDVLAYKVTNITTVLPTDLRPLGRHAGLDQVSLITCTPYGINTFRLIVTGSRIPLAAAASGAQWQQAFDWHVQSWMWSRVYVALGTLLLLLLVVVKWTYDDHRRRRRRRARLAKAAQLAAAQAAGEVTP